MHFLPEMRELVTREYGRVLVLGQRMRGCLGTGRTRSLRAGCHTPPCTLARASPRRSLCLSLSLSLSLSVSLSLCRSVSCWLSCFTLGLS